MLFLQKIVNRSSQWQQILHSWYCHGSLPDPLKVVQPGKINIRYLFRMPLRAVKTLWNSNENGVFRPKYDFLNIKKTKIVGKL